MDNGYMTNFGSDLEEDTDKEQPVHSTDSTDSSSEEDENGKEWTEQKEKDFFKTLCYLKKKDPKIYDGTVKFFSPVDENHPLTEPAKGNTHKENPLLLRDYERKLIIEKGGQFTDEEQSDDDECNLAGGNSPTYVEEQRALKERFQSILKKQDLDDSDDDHDFAGFLKLKTKTEKEKVQEEEEYVKWLKGQKSELSDKEMENELKYLRDYWSDPNLNEGEQFLRDYILNKRYLEKDEEQKNDELEFSEEKKLLEEADNYEHQYNFRFEEPDDKFTKAYPRVIENSLRRKDEKRKLKREEKKRKREQLLCEKQLEVKKLKRIKKQELSEKIEKLKSITGNQQLAFNDDDIEGDFNPDEYDQKMAQLFNEEFYAHEDYVKPEFSDFDDMADEYEDKELEDDDNFQETQEEDTQDQFANCDDDQSQSALELKFRRQTRSSRKKGHKKSKLMEAVEREKPVFNPADKTFEQYVDEYYGLEFEDIVGDIPVRFKYRKVVPNSYGLTIEEILAADDKELDKWCSMKNINTVQPESKEKFDLKAYSRKASNLQLKKKILPSLFEDHESAVKKDNVTKDDKPSTDATEIRSMGIRNKSKKKRKKIHGEPTNDREINQQELQENSTQKNVHYKVYKKNVKSTTTCEASVSNDGAKKKRAFQKNWDSVSNTVCKNDSISDVRLKAYGINPKRYKNKLKYCSK